MTAGVAAAGVDRRAGAASAYRAELAARRRALAAGPRADVVAVLAPARLACQDALARDAERIRLRGTARIDRARPRELARFPAELAADLDALGRRSDATFAAATGPGLRRVAARYCPGAPVLPLSPAGRGSTAPALSPTPALVPPPVRAGRVRALAADPRLAGPLAGLPVLAAHGLGVATVLLASGLLLLACGLGRARLLADDRARLREHLARAVVAATASGERELSRRLIRTEAAVVAALDRAGRERLAVVDAALAGTTPVPAGTAPAPASTGTARVSAGTTPPPAGTTSAPAGRGTAPAGVDRAAR